MAHVLVGRSAGNVLAGIGGRQVEARVDEIRVKLLGLLEIFDRRIELRVLEGGDTLVEKVAGTELVASGETCDECDQQRQKEHLTGNAGERRGRPPSNGYLSHGSFHP